MKQFILLCTALCCFSLLKSQSWLLTGNAGSNPSTNFIGTTDVQPLTFRIYNEFAGKLDGSLRQTFFGYHAGYNTNASDNTAIGYSALPGNSSGYNNTALGSYSLSQNTTGNENTGLGMGALNFNTSGSFNTAVGSLTLNHNTTGTQNVATGYQALANNTTGSYNVAHGQGALYSNIDGYSNTALGALALNANTSGYGNTALGEYTLTRNTNGVFNIAIGGTVLTNNISGSHNIAIGQNALYVNNSSYNTSVGDGSLATTTNAQYNTALGYFAGRSYNMGYNNVFLGANTNVNAAGYYNVIAIGQATVCTNSSQVTIGNGATSSYRVYANWTNISDGRFKKNVKEDVPGLDFIVKLRPVTYNLDAVGLDAFLHKNVKDSMSAEGKAVQVKALKEKEQELQMGFVAQEVEKTAKEMNLKISAVEAPHNENDVYGIRYAELVVPLVKAVQEQQEIIKKLQQDITDLKEQADLAVLLRETIVNEKINAYPNPVANDMTVTVTSKSEGRGTLQVFNSGNQLVKELNITINKGINTFGIKLPVLAAGYYTLKVNWGKDMHKQMSFIKAN